MKVPPQRIRAIDIFRGISILYMIMGHSLEFWLRNDDNWFPTLIPVFMDMIGSCAFIFLSGISLTLSQNAKQNRIKNDPNYLKIHANIDFIIKSLWLLVFALIYNIIVTSINRNSITLRAMINCLR